MSALNSIGGTVRLVLKVLCLAFLLFVQIVVNCSLLIAKIIELYNFLETLKNATSLPPRLRDFSVNSWLGTSLSYAMLIFYPSFSLFFFLNQVIF